MEVPTSLSGKRFLPPLKREIPNTAIITKVGASQCFSRYDIKVKKISLPMPDLSPLHAYWLRLNEPSARFRQERSS